MNNGSWLRLVTIPIAIVQDAPPSAHALRDPNLLPPGPGPGRPVGLSATQRVERDAAIPEDVKEFRDACAAADRVHAADRSRAAADAAAPVAPPDAQISCACVFFARLGDLHAVESVWTLKLSSSLVVTHVWTDQGLASLSLSVSERPETASESHASCVGYYDPRWAQQYASVCQRHL